MGCGCVAGVNNQVRLTNMPCCCRAVGTPLPIPRAEHAALHKNPEHPTPRTHRAQSAACCGFRTVRSRPPSGAPNNLVRTLQVKALQNTFIPNVEPIVVHTPVLECLWHDRTALGILCCHIGLMGWFSTPNHRGRRSIAFHPMLSGSQCSPWVVEQGFTKRWRDI